MADIPPQTEASDEPSPNIGLFGLKIFLASLTVLFAASLVAYVLIRMIARNRGLPLGTLHMPVTLWLSTALMLAGSLTIHTALSAIRLERRARFRRFMVATALLGLAFLGVQAPSLYELLQQHATFREQNVFLYGLIVMLIALHALHVIGGLVPLGVVTGRALRGAYSAGRHEGVQYCALYWHFLDVVWIVMFGLLFLTG